MPFFNSPNKYGNLYVEFKIVFPDKITTEQRKILSDIFKNEKIDIVDHLNKDMEKFNLEDFNESKMDSYYKGGKKEEKGEAADEDKTVNCNNQ